MIKAPSGRELEGPINDVLQRCMDWSLATAPTGPGRRPLEASTVTVDQRARRCDFVWPDGKKARADAQIIGFMVPEPGGGDPNATLWRWSWDDPSFDKAIVKHAQELRKYGSKHRIEELLLPQLRVHRTRCWMFAALAAALSGAAGTAGCPVDDKLVLLTIGPLKS